jgi:hypothetical protein
MKTKHRKHKNSNKTKRRKNKNNNKTKHIRNRHNKRHKHNNKTNKIGGDLTNNCKADPSKFPKCGLEGCVYLDNNNSVTKQQWKTQQQIEQHDLSIEGQTRSIPYAPAIISENTKECNVISKRGSENVAPCFVKRFRNTPRGTKILYEEENRDSWCKLYGTNKNGQNDYKCVVDDRMYEKFKTENAPKSGIAITENDIRESKIKLPETDDFLTGESSSIETGIDDEGLGKLLNNVPIDKSFTNINPIFLTNIKMNRIKGTTIFELISEMFEKIGLEKTKIVSDAWEREKNNIIAIINQRGYNSSDFNEQNIMIDVDDERLCLWIDNTLKEGIPITPEMIKTEFGKNNILKIVDWGLLTRSR